MNSSGSIWNVPHDSVHIERPRWIPSWPWKTRAPSVAWGQCQSISGWKNASGMRSPLLKRQ